MRGCRGHFCFLSATGENSKSFALRDYDVLKESFRVRQSFHWLVSHGSSSRSLLASNCITRSICGRDESSGFFLSTPWLPLSLPATMRLSNKWTNHSVAHISPASLTKQTKQSFTTNLSNSRIAHFHGSQWRGSFKKLFQIQLIRNSFPKFRLSHFVTHIDQVIEKLPLRQRRYMLTCTCSANTAVNHIRLKLSGAHLLSTFAPWCCAPAISSRSYLSGMLAC